MWALPVIVKLSSPRVPASIAPLNAVTVISCAPVDPRPASVTSSDSVREKVGFAEELR
jgi:hypothetical protein